MKQFETGEPFVTEAGSMLPSLQVSYYTYGTLNSDGSNAVWVCHALTANADVMDWWPGFAGPGCPIDTNKYFVVCANIPGSCYGSSGPLSINPQTGKPYHNSFPMLTIRDMVKAHMLLREHLGIVRIHLLVGGSMGGYQALEWAVMEPQKIERLFLLATSATESAWGIAVHTAQRLAIEADNTWNDASGNGGKQGLKAARAIGMLSYRNYSIMVKTQTDTDSGKLDNFKASSYIHHQGEKLANRFNAFSYWLLTKAMDTHHLARARHKTVPQILASITQPAFIIGISSDILCPVAEQEMLAAHMPHATLSVIDSIYGHDGFLVEKEKIAAHFMAWYNSLEQGK